MVNFIIACILFYLAVYVLGRIFDYKKYIGIIWSWSKGKKKNTPCTCGKYEDCIRKVEREGNRLVAKRHFECGKVQKQITDMHEYWKDKMK